VAEELRSLEEGIANEGDVIARLLNQAATSLRWQLWPPVAARIARRCRIWRIRDLAAVEAGGWRVAGIAGVFSGIADFDGAALSRCFFDFGWGVENATRRDTTAIATASAKI